MRSVTVQGTAESLHLIKHFITQIMHHIYVDTIKIIKYLKVLQHISYTVNYTHAQRVGICCHNTDRVHINGHDRIILVIFSQALHKAPCWWILCDPEHVEALLNIL